MEWQQYVLLVGQAKSLRKRGREYKNSVDKQLVYDMEEDRKSGSEWNPALLKTVLA